MEKTKPSRKAVRTLYELKKANSTLFLCDKKGNRQEIHKILVFPDKDLGGWSMRIHINGAQPTIPLEVYNVAETWLGALGNRLFPWDKWIETE